MSLSSDVLQDGEGLTFKDLPISDAVLRGIADYGFVRPSPIQAKAIPLARFGVDLIAQAKSGTGKTCVFAVVALESLQPNAGGGPQALIVTPTREIAVQVRDVCRGIGAHLPSLSCHAFIGGTPVRSDAALIGGCQLACGTPGRLVGHLLSEALLASGVRLLVLDEADKLCEEGFEPQLRYLLTALPPRKQTLAFSATFPAPLLATLRGAMRAPVYVSVVPGAGAASVRTATDGPPPEALAASGGSRSGGGAGGGGGEEVGGDAALLAVKQYYRVVGGTGGDEARAAEAVRVLDSLTFHQAHVFST
jgi:superfamily II DNA/RNA helicase